MIISGGVNIYPAEIEGVLMQHPEGRTTPRCSASPTTTGARRSRRSSNRSTGVDGDDALVDELLAHCADNLAKLKHPRSIDFVDEMPRDPNGKLYKRKLRDPVLGGRGPGDLSPGDAELRLTGAGHTCAGHGGSRRRGSPSGSGPGGDGPRRRRP